MMPLKAALKFNLLMVDTNELNCIGRKFVRKKHFALYTLSANSSTL